MNLKIIFLCINTVTAVTAHNHLRHKPEQDQITSFQNTKGELSRLLLLKGSDRLLGGSKDLGSCDKDKDCKGDNQECKSSSKDGEDGECECEKDYEVVGGVCVPKDDNGGSGGDGGAVATAKELTTEEEAELECLKDGAKDALDEDKEKDVADNLTILISDEPDGCGVAAAQLTCVKDCNDEIVDDCKRDLRNSGNSNPSHDYDDCGHLDNDLKHCYKDCYE